MVDRQTHLGRAPISGRSRRVARVLVLLAAALLPISCDFFTSPIPGFINGVLSNQVVDVADIVGDATPSEVRYDLAFITNGVTDLLLLRVTPPNPDPDSFVDLTQVIVMDPDGTEIGRLIPEPDTLDYLTRPYGLALNGDLLVGFSIFDLVDVAASEDPFVTPTEVSPHGLEGFVISDPPGAAPVATYLFAPVSGLFTSFHLEIRSYESAAPPDWAFTIATEPGQLNIVSDGTTLSADASQAQLGYQLLGMTYDGTDVRFLLSRPVDRVVLAVTAPLADILDGSLTQLISGDDAIEFQIDADRPRASVDDDGFFLLRRNGRFERYDWTGALESRVSGDTSFTRYYTFNVPGDRAYRFDPATSTLSIYEGWW